MADLSPEDRRYRATEPVLYNGTRYEPGQRVPLGFDFSATAALLASRAIARDPEAEATTPLAPAKKSTRARARD